MNKVREAQLAAPYAENQREVYLRTLMELAKAYPAIQLNHWPIFNRFVGGFRDREFSILCGPTGAGKSQFIANVSAQLIEQNKKHFVASIENGETDHMKRVLSCWERTDLNTGDPIPAAKLADISAKYLRLIDNGSVEFSLYDNRLSVEQLISDLDHMVANGCKIAFIDNLNFLLEITRSSEAIIEMDRVVHELIMYVKRTPIHIVMVMHPRKTEHGRVESEFDIKGSSTAVQEAQNVFLLNRPTQKDVMNGDRRWTDRELKLAKMRRRGIHVGKSIVFENHSTYYAEAGHK